MPQSYYKTDKFFSCSTNGRKYSFGNLIVNSYWSYTGPVCPRMTGPNLTQTMGLKFLFNAIGFVT
jgi:hypothetical protein